jgi:hypothetical protein
MPFQAQAFPHSAEEWLAAGEAIYRDIIAALARCGVAPDPALRLVPGELANPYYEPDTCSIGIGMPDPTTIQGRLYWLFAARTWGLSSVDEAIASSYQNLPWVMAHEVAHHLRHFYGIPNQNDFVEEQVCNIIAVAFVAEHPAYRDSLNGLYQQAVHASQNLRGFSNQALPHLSSFRMNASEVLVAEGKLTPERAEDARLLAEMRQSPLEVVLKEFGLVSTEEVAAAEERRREAESYFNRQYTDHLCEYFCFGNEWLRAYLGRGHFLSLGQALETYVLTDDWETTRREETLLWLSSLLDSPNQEMATSAAETLIAEAADETFPVLLRALEQGNPALQAAILRTCLSGPADSRSNNVQVLSIAQRLMDSSDAHVRATASAVVMHCDDESALSARQLLMQMLRSSQTECDAALQVLCDAGNADFFPALAALVRHPMASVRAGALQALTSLPPAVEVAALSLLSLRDEDDVVRNAAVVCLKNHAQPAMLSMLSETLRDPALAVRTSAIEVLYSYGQEAIPALQQVGGEWTARVEAALLVHKISNSSSGVSLHPLLHELMEASKILRAAHKSVSLDNGGPRQILLRDALGEEGEKLAHLALRLCGALTNSDSMQIVLQSLESQRDEVKQAGWRMLHEILPPTLAHDIKPLLAWLDSKIHSPNGQASMMQQLTVLLPLLSYPDAWIREVTTEILACPATPVEDALLGKNRERAGENQVLTAIEKLMFLRAVPIFRGAKLEELRPLTEELIVQHYGGGEIIFHQGEFGHSLFIITSGEIAIDIYEENTPEAVRLTTLHAGDCFGEAALFDDEPRSATATAQGDTTLLSLSREPFLRLAERRPHILIEVARVQQRRLRQTNLEFSKAQRQH